jgi:hypothetical protein
VADKKVFRTWDAEPLHKISKDLRAELDEDFGLIFTDQDIAEMEAALDDSHGAFIALKTAPQPTMLKKQFDQIGKTAVTLHKLLIPEETKPATGSNTNAAPQEGPAVAIDAAERIKLMLLAPRSHTPENDDDSGMTLDGAAPDMFDKFMRVLDLLPTLAEQAANSVDDFVISERGTAHLKFLRLGLEPVCERNGLSTSYTTEFVEGTRLSSICNLAFRIGLLLPKNARPSSEVALIEQMVREKRLKRA